MSVKIMGLVFEAALPHSEKSVLHALADHAEDDGSRVYPSIERLIYKTDLSERTIRRALRDLEARQILAVVKPGGHGRQTPTVYRILVENIPLKPPFEEWVAARQGATMTPLVQAATMTPLRRSKGVTQSVLGGHCVPLRGSHSPTKGVMVAPDPSYEPSVKPPREPSRARAQERHPDTELRPLREAASPIPAFETRRIVQPVAESPTLPTPPPPAERTTLGGKEAHALWRELCDRLAITPALRDSLFRPAHLYSFPDHSYLLVVHSSAALEVLWRFEDTIRRELVSQTHLRDLRLSIRARDRVRAEEQALV